MSKREDILEGFAEDKFNRIKAEGVTWKTARPVMRRTFRAQAQDDFEYLHKQGGVIGVWEGERDEQYPWENICGLYNLIEVKK